MKIRLEAFDRLTSDVMDVPEDTGLQFKLAMYQAPQIGNLNRGVPAMVAMHKIATFEFTGYYDGVSGVKIYRLIDIH